MSTTHKTTEGIGSSKSANLPTLESLDPLSNTSTGPDLSNVSPAKKKSSTLSKLKVKLNLNHRSSPIKGSSLDEESFDSRNSRNKHHVMTKQTSLDQPPNAARCSNSALGFRREKYNIPA